MFIVSLTYKTALSEIDKHIDEHIAFLEKHYASGHFLASGRKVPRTGGIILMKASNIDEAKHIMNQDPFLREDLVTVEYTEFIPTMTTDELATLKLC